MISLRTLDGRPTGTVRVAGRGLDRSDAEIAAFRADWIERRTKPYDRSLRADTFYTRIAQLASSTGGRTMGIIHTSPSGEALVRRRDMDRPLLDPVDPFVYDIFETRPNGSTTGRVSLPPRHRVLAFNGSRILTHVTDGSSGGATTKGEVIVLRIERPDAR